MPETYAPAGADLFPLRDPLRPLQATANRCGLRWADPFLLCHAHKADDEALRAAGEHFAARLRALALGAGTA